jgi:hypothetical protein
MDITQDTKTTGIDSDIVTTELSRLRLARAYIPSQRFRRRFDLMEGFQKGTIFPELFEPYRPRKGGSLR